MLSLSNEWSRSSRIVAVVREARRIFPTLPIFPRSSGSGSHWGSRLKRARRRVILYAVAAVPLAVVALTTALPPTPAFAGTDDYPAKWRNVPQDSVLDTWREYNRECTSFVAFRLSSRNGFEMPFYANAADWGTKAAALGYAVNSTPAVGAVAWSSSPQHVAWVEAISGASVTIEEYNQQYTGVYSERTVPISTFQYIHFKDVSGSGGPTSRFQTNFQANNGAMYQYSSTNGPASTGQGMMAGTSPSITALPGGGYQMAFQANNGALITIGDAGNINTGQGMMAGTSPSIAASPRGGYQIAFQANNGYLYQYSSTNGPAGTGQSMKAGTSPGIAALAGGGYQMAFQANNGALITIGDAGNLNTGQGMMDRTGPSIAASSRGGYQIAFQANNGYLYQFSSTNGPASTGQGMKAGTSPSITALAGGGYETAFQANNGNLYTNGDAGSSNTGQGMMDGTSPAIAPYGNSIEMSFQANTGSLIIFGAAINGDTGQGMMSGTSPSIAGA